MMAAIKTDTINYWKIKFEEIQSMADDVFTVQDVSANILPINYSQSHNLYNVNI